MPLHDFPEFSPLDVKATIEGIAEEVITLTERDIETSAAYKAAFKDGVDALEAALLTAFEVL